MGGGGGGSLEKKLSGAQHRRVSSFGPIFSQPAQLLTHFGSHFQVFSLEPPRWVGNEASQGEKIASSALKIEEYHVAKPPDPLLLTPKNPLVGRGGRHGFAIGSG